MTLEQIRNWRRERDIARQIGDEESRKIALQKVYDHRDDLQMESISEQMRKIQVALDNDRLLDARLKKVEKVIEPMRKHINEVRDWKLRVDGAKIFVTLMKYAVALGAGGVVAKYFGL